MNKFELFKKATCFVVGVGVSQIISGIVDSLVPQDTITQKVPVFAGKIAISMVVGEVIKSNVNEQLDNAALWYNKNVTERELSK